MDINKNNWEYKMKVSNILVGCRLKLISIGEAEKLMSALLNESFKGAKK